MAKTSAERQAEYRAKRAGESNTERRLNTWVGSGVCVEIERLAERYGVTKRAVIELLVLNGDGRLKELKAKGVITPERPVKALRRNKSQEVAVPKAGPGRRSAGVLLRNKKSKAEIKSPESEPVQAEQTQPAQQLGNQFGFEFG